MYVCIYVYLCQRVYVCMYVCVHVCMYVYVWQCRRVCVCVCARACTYTTLPPLQRTIMVEENALEMWSLASRLSKKKEEKQWNLASRLPKACRNASHYIYTNVLAGHIIVLGGKSETAQGLALAITSTSHGLKHISNTIATPHACHQSHLLWNVCALVYLLPYVYVLFLESNTRGYCGPGNFQF